MSGLQAWPDPMITIGPYRILPRTDSRWTAYDERMPPGERDAFIADTKVEAIAGAEDLVRRGAPVGVIAAEPPPIDRSARATDALPTSDGKRKKASRGGSR